MDIKTLRNTAKELAEKGIVCPYFMKINKMDIESFECLPGFVPVSEYSETIIRYSLFGFFEIGACGVFRFVMPERRKGEDRRLSSCRFGTLKSNGRVSTIMNKQNNNN